MAVTAHGATQRVRRSAVQPVRCARVADAAPDAMAGVTRRGAALSLLTGVTLVAWGTGATAASEWKWPCGIDSPCIPPPPNGEPRYVMPGAAYSPAKAAEEALKAKLAAKQAAAADTKQE